MSRMVVCLDHASASFRCTHTHTELLLCVSMACVCVCVFVCAGMCMCVCGYTTFSLNMFMYDVCVSFFVCMDWWGSLLLLRSWFWWLHACCLISHWLIIYACTSSWMMVMIHAGDVFHHGSFLEGSHHHAEKSFFACRLRDLQGSYAMQCNTSCCADVCADWDSLNLPCSTW